MKDVGRVPPILPGTRPLTDAEVTSEVGGWAVELLAALDFPLGGTSRRRLGGRDLLARAEWHPDNGRLRGWHRGVTMFAVTDSSKLFAAQRFTTRFHRQLAALAAELGVDARWLLAVIAHESGGAPDAVNPMSGASGLIQFMADTIAPWGLTTSQVRAMSAEEQLPHVRRYFRGAPHPTSLGNCYLVVFWPAAVGKPDDYVIAATPDKATYRQNAPLDFDKDGDITAGDVRRHFESWVRKSSIAAALVEEHERELAREYGPAKGEVYLTESIGISQPPAGDDVFGFRAVVANETEADRFVRCLEHVLEYGNDMRRCEPGASSKQSTCMIVNRAADAHSRRLPADKWTVVREPVEVPGRKGTFIDWGDYAQEVRDGDNYVDLPLMYLAKKYDAWCGQDDDAYPEGPKRGAGLYVHHPGVGNSEHVVHIVEVVGRVGNVLTVKTIEGGQAGVHVQRFTRIFVWDPARKLWCSGDLKGKVVKGWQVRSSTIVAGRGKWPYPDSFVAKAPEPEPVVPALPDPEVHPDPFPAPPAEAPTGDRSPVEAKPDDAPALPPAAQSLLRRLLTPTVVRSAALAAFGGVGLLLAVLAQRCDPPPAAAPADAGVDSHEAAR